MNKVREEKVLLGFETVNPSDGCCFVKPRPSKMKPTAWVATGALFFFAFPFVWVPLVTSCSYPPFERPVYGTKPTTADRIATANF